MLSVAPPTAVSMETEDRIFLPTLLLAAPPSSSAVQSLFLQSVQRRLQLLHLLLQLSLLLLQLTDLQLSEHIAVISMTRRFCCGPSASPSP